MISKKIEWDSDEKESSGEKAQRKKIIHKSSIPRRDRFGRTIFTFQLS